MRKTREVLVFACIGLGMFMQSSHAQQPQRLSDVELAQISGGGWFYFTLNRKDWENAVFAAVTWGAIYAAGNVIKLHYDIPSTWPSVAAGTACGSVVQGGNKLWKSRTDLPNNWNRRVDVLDVMWRAGSVIAAGTACNVVVGGIQKAVSKDYSLYKKLSKPKRRQIDQEMQMIQRNASASSTYANQAINITAQLVPLQATWNTSCGLTSHTVACSDLEAKLTALSQQLAEAERAHEDAVISVLEGVKQLNGTLHS